jgi:hypothetical protein
MPSEREQSKMLSLMLPRAVKIQPFTRVASFDGDEVPDGILAVVQPQDRFGDPVKAAGFFYFELWTYRQASQERKGERLAYWERTIASSSEVDLYWTRAMMYEFQLAWTRGLEAIQPNRKYVLTVAYRTPWDETIRDEHVFEFILPDQPMTASNR